MRKKLISLFVTLIMIVSTLPVAMAENDENEFIASQQKIDVVTSLGLMRIADNGNFLGHVTIKGTDFTTAMSQFGYTGMIKDDEMVTFKYLGAAFANAMGYTAFAETEDELYNASLSFDIFKDMSIDPDRGVTRYEFAEALYNFLEEYVYEREYGVKPKFTKTDETVLEHYLHKRKGTGMVNDDGYNTLYGSSKVGASRVKIDNTVYYLTNDNKSMPIQYLGRVVDFYYSIDKDDRNTICYMTYSLSGDQDKELEIDAEDIVSYKNNAIEYRVNGKTRKVSIVGGPIILRNGERVTTYDAETLLSFKEGSVTLSQKSGGAYSLMVIKDYKTVVVGDIVDYTYRICSKLYDDTNPENDRYTYLDPTEKCVSIYNLNGKTLSFNDIKVDNVLSVAESGNKIEVIVSNREVSDYKLVSVQTKTKNSKQYTVINDTLGREYIVSDDYIDCMGREIFVQDSNLTLYVNKFGHVANVIKTAASGEEIGVLLNASYDEDKEILYVRFLDGTGTKQEYTTANKVSYTDEWGNFYRYTAEETYRPLRLILNSGSTEVLRYILDDEGKIKIIKEFLNPDADYSDGDSRKVYDGQARRYMSSFGNFSADNNTKFFITTSDGYTNADNYFVTTSKETMRHNGSYCQMEAYSSRNIYADYVIVYDLLGDRKLPYEETTFGVVTDIYESVDTEKDEPVVTVEVNGKTQYKMEKSVAENAYDCLTGTDATPNRYTVKVGDIIRVLNNPLTNRVNSIAIVFRLGASEDPAYPAVSLGHVPGSTGMYDPTNNKSIPFKLDGDGNRISSGLSVGSDANRVGYGSVYDVNGNSVMLTTQDLGVHGVTYVGDTYTDTSAGHATWTVTIPTNSLLVTYIGNDESPVISTGSVSNIRSYKNAGDNCSKVITLHRGYDGQIQTIIINEE